MNEKTTTKFHSSVKSVGALPDTSGSKGVCADLKRLRGKFNSPFKFTSGFKRKCAMALMLSAVSYQLSAAPIASRPSPIANSDAVRAIVGEAANQGRDGMLAVAGAIRNRGTLRGVYGFKNPVADKQPAWVWKRARAAWAISATNDITRGATHWENVRAFGKPYWADSMTITTNIGGHVFYR